MNQKIKLLLIEDNQGDARLFTEIMKEAKLSEFDINWSKSLQEGIKHLENNLPDILFLDLGLPDSQGLDGLKKLKKLYKYLPVIIMTGLDDTNMGLEAVREGAEDYIVKGTLIGENIERTIQYGIERVKTRKKLRDAEKTLYESREQLAYLVDNVIDPLIVIDRKRLIKFVNNAACNFIGKEEDVLLGTEFEFPVELDKISEILITAPDGEKRYAEAKSSLINWEGKQSYLMSLRDITKRKQAVEEREKINIHLQQVDKIESIGNLAGGIAHDFNNMLSVILGYGQELLSDLDSDDPLHESASEIVQAGQRSAELTRQLLAFSRRQTLQPEVLNLSYIIKNIESMLRRLISEDIELTIKLTDDLRSVEVDPGQIEQVIINMAVNARDAMPRGGKLIIEAANFKFDEQYTKTHPEAVPGEYVMLSMTDNGCGMSKETLDRVFEPFYTTKEKGKGTGLGLSTVYGIIKQSGGYIYAYSEPGHGTTFKMYLPSTDKDLPGKKDDDNIDSIKSRGEKVLLVEDEEALRKYCKKILESLDYELEVAENGNEALLMVEEKKLHPDLILTDVIMPGMSGKTLVEILKETIPDLKVLYMSGYTDDAIVHHGVLEEGTPFIQKPFTKNKLGKKIRSLLDKP